MPNKTICPRPTGASITALRFSISSGPSSQPESSGLRGGYSTTGFAGGLELAAAGSKAGPDSHHTAVGFSIPKAKGFLVSTSAASRDPVKGCAIQRQQYSPAPNEFPQSFGARVPQAAGKLRRHQACRSAIRDRTEARLDDLRRCIRKDDHVKSSQQAPSPNVPVEEGGIRKLKLLQQPPCPAFIRIGHVALIKPDAGQAQLNAPVSRSGVGKRQTEIPRQLRQQGRRRAAIVDEERSSRRIAPDGCARF